MQVWELDASLSSEASRSSRIESVVAATAEQPCRVEVEVAPSLGRSDRPVRDIRSVSEWVLFNQLLATTTVVENVDKRCRTRGSATDREIEMEFDGKGTQVCMYDRDRSSHVIQDPSVWAKGARADHTDNLMFRTSIIIDFG
jgi:hypothetical protein